MLVEQALVSASMWVGDPWCVAMVTSEGGGTEDESQRPSLGHTWEVSPLFQIILIGTLMR